MLTWSRTPAALLVGPILVLTACTSDSDAGDPQTSAVSPSTTTAVQPNSFDPIGTTEGVVVDVEGTLGSVMSFTIRLRDGTDATFVPVDGLLFDGSAPIDHVRDHLVSGAPVRVDYDTLDDGTLSALAVGDA